MSLLIQAKHKQQLFRNSHVHYKKLEGLMEEQHLLILRMVEELMLMDPAGLLQQQCLLLDRIFLELGKGSTLH